ncbi:hypothetical protein NMY22_g8489 [Coprinellus aureogranulatus]|nr:hypothetical protein NMY22_g8489 [Coprinellus aureogranulatus]
MDNFQHASAFSPTTRLLVDTRGSADAESYREKIAQRLSELEEETQALKMAHNATITVHLLPAEILSNIFVMLAATSGDGLWIRITWVCSRWRRVALDCASLWTRLPLLNAKFTTIALSRTKNSPISVSPPPGPSAQKLVSVMADILACTERLRSVVLRGPRYRLSQMLSKCSGAAPVLETLQLRSYRSSHYLVISESDTEAESERERLDFYHLLKGGTPCLRNLQVVTCGVAWSSLPLATSLTQLRLRDTHTSDAHRPTMSSLLEFLKQAQSLQKLCLAFFLPAEAPDNTHGGLFKAASLIALPMLEHISLCDRTGPLQRFFEDIVIPNARVVNVQFFSDSLTAEDVGRFIPYIHASWKNASLRTRHMLERAITRLYIKSDNFRIGDDDSDSDAEDARAIARLGWPTTTFEFKFEADVHDNTSRRNWLHLTFLRSSPTVRDALNTFKERLNIGSALHGLIVDSIDHLPKAEWASLFLRSPNIRVIALAHVSQPLYSFLEALEAEPVSQDGDGENGRTTGGPEPHLPRLRSLRFYSIDMDKRCRANATGVVTRLLQLLTKRAGTYPIEHLLLNLCRDYYRDDNEMIQQGVPDLKLTWDGVEKAVVDPEWSSDSDEDTSDDDS